MQQDLKLVLLMRLASEEEDASIVGSLRVSLELVLLRIFVTFKLSHVSLIP